TGGPLVLIVDDEPTALQLMRDYLDENIYQVVGTHSADQALDLARHLQPDLIITDVLMPGINGWDLLRTLKRDTTTAQIPVIVSTVLDQASQGRDLGAVGYLRKPVERDTLLREVETALGGRQRRQA
ncbi:MAG: response regulator, partial [Chloroflexi bacterium]|nr:response regulator [Chloroflexota bacterium]